VHRVLAREPPHRVFRCQVHAPLELLEAGPRALERDDLAVEHDLVPRQRLRERPQLGVARGHVATAAGLQDQAPALHERDRAHAVPLDLERPAAVVVRKRTRAREHRLELFGHRLALGVVRGIHAMDHPVVALGAEQHVASPHALPVEGDHHLRVAELVLLVRAAVPDRHRPGAVLPGRDRALELEVLERVVLGAHGQVIALGTRGDAARDGP
jgi:hypothetical protein